MLEPAQASRRKRFTCCAIISSGSTSIPQRLREVEQRLDAVHASARKYRVIAGHVARTRWQRARARLAELGGGGDVDALRKREARGA